MDFYSEEYGKYIDLVGYLYPDLDFAEEEAIEVDFKVIDDEENNEGGLLNE